MFGRKLILAAIFALGSSPSIVSAATASAVLEVEIAASFHNRSATPLKDLGVTYDVTVAACEVGKCKQEGGSGSGSAFADLTSTPSPGTSISGVEVQDDSFITILDGTLDAFSTAAPKHSYYSAQVVSLFVTLTAHNPSSETVELFVTSTGYLDALTTPAQFPGGEQSSY
ncbi:MAG: hypothetical protein ACPGNV_07040 [Mangrovicoccus sp.]